MRNVAFTPIAFKEYNYWFEVNKQIIERIKILIRDIDNSPFKGLGKPEPLKGNWSGYWSRRIDQEHRLIYKVNDTGILIAKCKGHY
ncbi:Txe/YoeB family addiction module toxin [Mucilaginibacter paludis]|uniref:Putative mRNA interferase YoeB n=1 Tax=Mucilaginibacter paludis DSM 18603 TaxID=714943 RepID=H1XZI4_9SPHI|nr:Txe/YoeB family addiction module toxin [Mucilaginibacter paludis]EHQ26628.1 addiction module toxin, Txe/YoeB family [Mucilaginibacter paludis DSM 18603]